MATRTSEGGHEGLQHQELTYEIRGAVFEVFRVLGAGFLERVYENALVEELRRRGVRAQQQVPLKVWYKEQEIGEYTADLVVEDRVLVELKAVKCLMPEHEAQILNYLKATGITIGLLVNFNFPKAQIKRFVM